MGRKKKFIDKRNSATFQLLARDSSPCDPSAASSSPDALADADRVFVRVDNNSHYPAPGTFVEEPPLECGVHRRDRSLDDPDPYSIFADAAEDEDDAEDGHAFAVAAPRAQPGVSALPDHVRREILELGLPDDGYNYLEHLREIRNTGGGSNYYHNNKARLDRLPRDEKAYDASRVRVSAEVDGDIGGKDSMYDVAARTVGVKVGKAVDPDVLRLLDDSDLSRFGSDVEDLEEDFVVRANCLEEGEDGASGCKTGGQGIMAARVTDVLVDDDSLKKRRPLEVGSRDELRDYTRQDGMELGNGEGQRSRRALDEQFDTLIVHEYADDSEDDDPCYSESKGEESVAAEIKNVLKEHSQDEFEFEEDYKVPADILRRGQGKTSIELLGMSADVLHRCTEYAKKYNQEESDHEKLVTYDESSDESDVWDCETIISTYSNLDNHPGRIHAPEKPKRRPQLSESFPMVSGDRRKIIALGGKEMLPLDFLPHGRRKPVEKVKEVENSGLPHSKRRSNESKEEKKERKAGVRESRREARQAKKELKGLYKSEAQMAQKVAAVSGPSSIHLV